MKRLVKIYPFSADVKAPALNFYGYQSYSAMNSAVFSSEYSTCFE